ncbi:MAG TPA: NAD(P)-binding domain-containing protein, partial [Pilimelia sp.]|nr:NAD(P)-binding domain-containing protein [Pilimelia sp.]
MDVAVIGLGLIGGSVLRARAGRGVPTRGYDADPATRALARTAAGAAPRWRVADSVPDAVAGADLVILAVPLPAVAPVL